MVDDQITVLIPTSPIPSHPSTAVIDKVIASVRFHLPTARIILMCDGVRPQVEHRRKQYTHYLENLHENRFTGKLSTWDLLLPWYEMRFFEEPTQQAQMMRETLELVTTPLVFFLEHDTYLPMDWNPRDEENTGQTHPEDCKIAWQDIADIITSGGVNMVRFYLWEKIWREHQHLMRGQMVQGNSKFIQTVQYSQWPNVGSTAFYRKILSEHFHPDDRKMIEPVMYGPVSEAPWDDYRVVIYYPEPNARRFYHLNARADENGVRDPCDW